MLTLKQIYDKLTSDSRISDYKVYEDLYEGDHFQAFSIKAEDFKEDYARLRYVVCNFAGLTSKVVADMLFGEPLRLRDEANQDWIDALVFENSLDTLFYEHSIANSYFGDNLFKIRVENNRVFIEDTPPALYIPEIDGGNTRAKPKAINIAYLKTVGDIKYLIVERHAPPKVSIEIGQITDASKGRVTPVTVETYNAAAGTNLVAEVDTKINRFLIKHVPNPKPRGHFGQSDYIDLKPLLFGLNNRMTKTDNILDKHSDPILAVPPGVLDEEGKVKKEAFTMFEMTEEGAKPEYIVWNANLDNAMKQIDKMVEFLFMFSETSPDVMGMGKGSVAESGRALKMRLLRTIAKRNRKKLYYDAAVKDLIFTTELLCKANPSFKISDDVKAKLGEPSIPETKWQDGIVNDEVERTDIAIKRVEAGLMSEKRAIMELDDVSDTEAEEELKQIKTEKKEKESSFTSLLDKNKNPNNPDNNQNGDKSEE
jgi:hypothetical protein